MAINITLGMPSAKAYRMLQEGSHYYDPDKLAESFGLGRSELNKALQMAENKVLKWVKTQFVRNLQGQIEGSERVKITQKMLKNRIRIAHAHKDATAASMWAGLYKMNLRRFGVGRAIGKGYRVKGRMVDGGFRATMRSGHEGIFYRLTDDRLPIVEEGVVIKDHGWTSINEVMNKAEDRLVQELKQALKLLMSRKHSVG